MRALVDDHPTQPELFFDHFGDENYWVALPSGAVLSALDATRSTDPDTRFCGANALRMNAERILDRLGVADV